MASRVPLDNFNLGLVSSPDLLWLRWEIERPQIDFGAASCCELAIVLPSDIDDESRLVEGVHGVHVDLVRFPY